MNHVASFYLMTADEPLALSELATVALVSDVVTDEGRVIGAGTCGTAVGVWCGGTACDVEFIAPFAALVTVGAGEIRPDGRWQVVETLAEEASLVPVAPS